MAKPRNSIMDRARKQVEQQIKLAEDERRRAMMKKRMEYITQGAKAMERKKIGEAVVNFQAYIKLLEEWKGVGEGGLTPAQFDITKEMGDMLMLAGIYWDLARFLDRTDSPEKQLDFLHYLEKFITFSKGTQWQPLCAEQLRRYLLANRPRHRQDFKNAYKLIGTEKCFVVTALADETAQATLPTLRRFRDEVLDTSAAGRVLIEAYYRVGPALAQLVRWLPRFVRKRLARFFDRLALRISARFY